MSFSLTDKDRGYADLLKRIASAANAKGVSVGVHEEEGSKPHGEDENDEATVADIASFHEFGLGVPRRSFIADYVDESETKIKDDLRKIGAALVEGKIATPEQGLDRFGLLQKAEVQKRIRDGIEPENDPATIAAKGSSTPLIASGKLWTSILHKIDRK